MISDCLEVRDFGSVVASSTHREDGKRSLDIVRDKNAKGNPANPAGCKHSRAADRHGARTTVGNVDETVRDNGKWRTVTIPIGLSESKVGDREANLQCCAVCCSSPLRKSNFRE
jgi:hypothetical protein